MIALIKKIYLYILYFYYYIFNDYNSIKESLHIGLLIDKFNKASFKLQEYKKEKKALKEKNKNTLIKVAKGIKSFREAYRKIKPDDKNIKFSINVHIFHDEDVEIISKLSEILKCKVIDVTDNYRICGRDFIVSLSDFKEHNESI